MILGSLGWDDFLDKFQVSFPMFNWILRSTMEFGEFPFEALDNGRHKPLPLCLKISAYFRYMATRVYYVHFV